jgi:ribosomal-protein-alanine N-acetyltransferase
MTSLASSDEEDVFNIREYRPEDFESICALDRLCFPETIAYTPEDIALALVQRGAFTFVAEVPEHAPERAEARVVAFILAYQKKPLLGHIVTLDVHPDFRRQSIGHHLMERAEQRLRERGAARIILEVGVANDTALRFYEKRGFLRQKLLRHYYADRSDAYLMEKALG